MHPAPALFSITLAPAALASAPNAALAPAASTAGLLLARTLGALGLAFVVAVVCGRAYVPWLRRLGIRDGDSVKDSETLRALAAQANKAHTPTMGGPVFLAGIACAALVFLGWSSPTLWLALGTLVALAAIGSVDDRAKLRRTGTDGMRTRTKLALQVGVALIVSLGVWISTPAGPATGWVFVPGFGALALGLAVVPLSVLAIVGTSNAVNLTDGLDGLATGTAVLVAAALAALSVVFSDPALAGAFGLVPHPGAADVAVLAGAVVGGGLGFLWFNAPPAQVFMGDTGSLPLGGVIGLLAVLLGRELGLIVLGGVLVAEAGSVVLQVASYKTRKKRVFRCAPLHHHFQFGHCPETRLVVRFWIAGALCVALGTALALA